jgi:recombination protein RecT
MSSTALKSAVTGTAVTTAAKAPPKTIAALLTDPQIKQQMALAMPKHMTADRLARIALTEVRKVPKLAQCDQVSFLGAIMQCAALGLEPGGALGHAYLLPFDKNKKDSNGKWVKDKTEVQLIIGYRGMIDLARRSGQIQSIEARVVNAKDEFEIELGLDSKLVHKPAWTETDRGPMVFVYAVAKLKDGGIQFEVMSRAEIEKVRNESQGYKAAASAAQKYNKPIDSPWSNHFDEMAKKTVVRRLFKYLPVSIEMQRAVGLDEQADAGIPQHNAMLIDGDYSHITPEDEQQALPADADGVLLTVAEVKARMEAAADRDALDAVYDDVRMFERTEDRAALTAAYELRCDALDLAAQ